MRARMILFVMLAMGIGAAAGAQPGAPVEVADLSVAVEGRNARELYYAFAGGDRIILDVETTDQKPLSGIEVIEYPQQVRFRELEAVSVKGKTIEVQATGVYFFRLRNEEKRDRLCKVRITRIPAREDLRHFQTAVKWVEQYDTIIQSNIARTELRQVRRTRRVLSRVDTAVVNLLDRTERVNSLTKWGGKTTGTIKVELPAYQESPDRSEEVLAWSYWIGVGNEAEVQYQEANRMLSLAKTGVGSAVKIGLLSSGYGALAVLAIEGVSFFARPTKGDNVKFRVLSGETLIDEGNAVATFARQAGLRQGTVTFELTNDNIIDALDVQLRVIAITLVRHYQEEVYFEEQQVPVIDSKIQVRKVPVVTN